MGKFRTYEDDYGRNVTIKGGKHYYNERTGGYNGRLHDDQFSIGGRSWDYRDPSKHNNTTQWAKSDRGINPNPSNTNARSEFNPLYDYSFGAVRDAAKELGIGNVDEPEEVDQIRNYIQQGRVSKEESNSTPGEAQRPAEPLLPRGERVPRFNETGSQTSSMSNENATTSEIGDNSRYFLDKFVFDTPKLGNVQDVYENYKKAIEALD